MITQKFKGDQNELRMEAVARPAFEISSASKDQFFAGGFTSSDFLLMLYDSGRMPFAERVPRDSFVSFFQQALQVFPVTGTFEAYLFIVRKVFGEGSGVLFDVTSPGKLSILVNASTSLSLDFEGREFINGAYITFGMETNSGDQIQFRGLSGIDSEAELSQLLSEIIPAGIYTDIALAFFALYDFISSDGFQIIDHLGNQITFIEN